MRSITVEALWGNDSKCLWCSRNIHVSCALQNPIGLAAFEERQMNNQKRGGIQREKSFGEEKRGEKWKSEAAFALLGLWSSSSSRHWYTDTHKGTQALSPSLPLYSRCLSLFSLFHLLPIPSSSPSICSRDPPCPPVLTTRLLSRLWYLYAERSTVYFGSISPATTALITATKPRLFNCTDSRLFVIHSHYHFPKALKHMHAELTSWFL